LLFGLLLVPYRLIRRTDRNREPEVPQHQELLACMGQAPQVHVPTPSHRRTARQVVSGHD
jgi:hypothetical protein